MPASSEPILGADIDQTGSAPVSLEIKASTGCYEVSIAPGLLERTLSQGGDRVYIVDAFFAPVFAAAGLDAIVIEADESAKSLDRMTEIVVAMRERRATRATTLVAVGGGVVQDAAAFMASVYMRGLEWMYLPTTLLSMTDSCIGGKSSINVGHLKNIIGTIHPPQRVIVDPAVTVTLSSEERAAGLCEAVKICLCRGPEALAAYMALGPSVDMPMDALTSVIATSLETKKWFIEKDEFDRAERLLLNFGHTFGHALEAASGFGVSHGIAVGLGMLTALRLGEAMGIRYRDDPQIAGFHAHVVELIKSVDGLDAVLAEVKVPSLMNAFGADKKHRQDSYVVIMVGKDMRVERIALPRDDATSTAVAAAFSEIVSDWSASLAP